MERHSLTASLSRLRCARKPKRLSLSVTNGSSATVRSLFSQRRSAGQCCGHCGTFSLENQQVEVFGEQRDEIPFLLSGEGQRNSSAAMRWPIRLGSDTVLVFARFGRHTRSKRTNHRGRAWLQRMATQCSAAQRSAAQRSALHSMKSTYRRQRNQRDTRLERYFLHTVRIVSISSNGR